MRETTMRGTDLALLAGTRVALGVGIGLLVAERLDARARRGAGAALLIVGALTTVPIVLNAIASSRGHLFGERGAMGRAGMHSGSERREAGGPDGQPATR
jgi:hypothetical protein